jgi:predicted dienelactone hydrolase
MRSLLLFFAALVSSGCASIAKTTLPFNNLPPPSGPFAVGTSIETWEDKSRAETFTDDPEDYRRIAVQYWYPIAEGDAGTTSQYIDQPALKMRAFAKNMGLPRWLVGHIQDIETNSTLDAPPHPSNGSYPVVVFSHGLGGMKTQNSILAEELASHGYLVVAADHAFDAFLTVFDDGTVADYRSGSDGINTEEEFWAARGPQLAARAGDIRFMLDRIAAQQAHPSGGSDIVTLWQRADLSRVGVFGHSFGGATSIMASDQDPRVLAAAALDGWMVPIPRDVIKRGTGKPFLYLGQAQWDDPLNYKKLEKFMSNSDGDVHSEFLANTKHMDFADTPHLSSFAKRIGFAGSMPSGDLRDKLNADILGFFGQHLSRQKAENTTSP